MVFEDDLVYISFFPDNEGNARLPYAKAGCYHYSGIKVDLVLARSNLGELLVRRYYFERVYPFQWKISLWTFPSWVVGR